MIQLANVETSDELRRSNLQYDETGCIDVFSAFVLAKAARTSALRIALNLRLIRLGARTLFSAALEPIRFDLPSEVSG